MRGFQPNASAQRLVTKVSKTIAVVSSLSPRYFFIESDYSKTLAGIVKYSNSSDYRIMLDIGGKGFDCINLYKKKIIDAIIIIDAGHENHLLHEIMSTKIPFVLLGSPSREIQELTWVDVDSTAGVFDAVIYLISLGHRNIAMINGSMHRAPSINKYAGFKKAMDTAGIKIRPENIINCEEIDTVSGYEAAKKLLSRDDRPSAIFTYADMVAMGVYKAAKEIGLKIPQDVSVVGFDNSDKSQICEPDLTTVAQPIYDKGYMVSRYLIEMLQTINSSEIYRHHHILLPCSLIIRNSCCPPSGLLL